MRFGLKIAASAASTGHMGGGRIFVLPVDRSVRVRD